MRVAYTAFYRPVPPIIGIPVSVVVGLLALVTLPLTVPLHFLLRKLGRRGFVVKAADRFELSVGPESFDRTV